MTECVPSKDIPVVYNPILIMVALNVCLAIGGKYSSKNIYGQHRVMLTLYSLCGLVDTLGMWLQLIFTIWMAKPGHIWHIIVPLIALFANYYLNFKYVKLWG